MNNNTTLLRIITEYRNGNKSALGNLYAMKNGSNLITQNDELGAMIKKAYNDFTKIGIKTQMGGYKKYYAPAYDGDIADMEMVFFECITELAENTEFQPKNDSEITCLLKHNVTKYVNNYLSGMNITVSSSVFGELSDKLEYNYNDDGDSYAEYDDRYNADYKLSHNDEQLYYRYTQKCIRICEPSLGAGNYIFPMGEFYNLAENDKIKELLPTGAEFLERIIDILKLPESVNTDEHGIITPAQHSKISQIYSVLYGISPSASQISNAYESIYAAMMKCCYGYEPVKRTQFIGGNYCAYDRLGYHKVIADKTRDIIDKAAAGRLKDNSKYFKIYDTVVESVRNSIRDLELKGYSPDTDTILDLLFHTESYGSGNLHYWYLYGSDGSNMKISEYNRKADGTYSLCRGKSTPVTFSEPPEIYEFGNCIVIADTVSRELYYYQRCQRLYHMVKRKNVYMGIAGGYNSLIEKTA